MKELKDLVKVLEKLEKEKKEKEEIEQLEEDEKVVVTKEDREKINRMLDNAEAMIVCTDKGIFTYGGMLDYMNILSNIANNLKEEMPKQSIEFAIKNGLREFDSIEDVLNFVKENI